MLTQAIQDIPGLNISEIMLKGFKIHELPRSVNASVTRGRRDFYKVGLVTGQYDDVL